MIRCLNNYELFLSKIGVIMTNSKITKNNINIHKSISSHIKSLSPYKLSKSIFNHYIFLDNQHIKTLLRSLMTIHTRRIRIVKMKAFSKWCITTKKDKRKKRMVSAQRTSERLYNDYKDKENYLQLLKIIYHYKEGEDCTFRPKTNKTPLLKYFLKNNLSSHKKTSRTSSCSLSNASLLSSVNFNLNVNVSNNNIVVKQMMDNSISNNSKYKKNRSSSTSSIISLKKNKGILAHRVFYDDTKRSTIQRTKSINSSNDNTLSLSTTKQKCSYSKDVLSLSSVRLSFSPKYKEIPHVTLQSNSDAMEIADKLIPTDESLEEFEKCLKKKKTKKKYYQLI